MYIQHYQVVWLRFAVLNQPRDTVGLKKNSRWVKIAYYLSADPSDKGMIFRYQDMEPAVSVYKVIGTSHMLVLGVKFYFNLGLFDLKHGLIPFSYLI